MSHERVPNEEPPQCPYCRLDPLPESAQYLPLVILEALLIFLSFKLALILLCLGYCFSRTLWVCPMCKREVEAEVKPPGEHIILRLSDCMMILSKTKFRVGAALAVLLLAYSIYTEPAARPRLPVEQTWRSLLTNCGLEMQLENSLNANLFYERYENIPWTLDGAVFLGMETNNPKQVTMRVKMDPTQFRDPETEDVQVLLARPASPPQKGDQLRFTGEFQGRRGHTFFFVASGMELTGKRYSNIETEVEFFSTGMLRRHHEVIEQEKEESAKSQEKKDITPPSN